MTHLPDAMLGDPPPDPFRLFDRWFTDAARHEQHEVTAMTLSTADEEGRPNSRIVLLKHHDDRGFVFYTNYSSEKSRELSSNPNAALMFWFPVLQRSIRVRGGVSRVPDAESDAYFAGRPRDSQLGAWASDQSAALDARRTLEDRLVELRHRFEGRTVDRPHQWGGWRLEPNHFEFWHEGEARLHDRITYSREGVTWRIARLYP